MSAIIKINNQEFAFTAGESVLQVARRNKIFIPALCSHPDFPAKGNCRLCLVEFVKEGKRQIVSSCSLVASSGMEIFLDTARIKRLRKINLELLFAEHVEKCPTCELRSNCALLNLAKQYKVKTSRFPDRKINRPAYAFGPAVVLDGSKCIDCRLCLDACNNLQKLNCLELKGSGINQEIVPTKNPCTYCGQCVTHCPVAAFQEQTQHQEVTKLLSAKNNQIIIAQFAPSIRAAIGEEFGLEYDEKMTGRIVAALKRLGFDYVFDVNLGADITTIVEAEELLARLNDKKAVFPMTTSCCPAWVRYVETRRPDLIPHLTTSRSPHIHLGGAIKNYWAPQQGIKPQEIIVVSVMPCTAKKYEATRTELSNFQIAPVDYVITTRELAVMIKNKKINFAKLSPKKSDLMWNNGSGAGAIYGASGGVMESALRTAASKLESNVNLARLEFSEVRGMKGLKEALVKIGDKELRVAVVNGLGNIDEVLKKLSDFDYIEVMSCPGGCIGGGGQPFPVSNEIRKKRAQALYDIDALQSMRRAHENPEARAAVKYAQDNKLSHKLLHTKFKANNK